jgi:4'-phosphopantetheinyl transferase
MVKSLINVFYTTLKFPLPESLYSQYLSLFPREMQKVNSRYLRWKDRHLHLFGKLLLIEGLKIHDYHSGDLFNIQYNEYNRPYLNDDIDFNISHSGDYVVFAITKGSRLGVDIEEIKKINLNDFQRVMTPSQWDKIYSAKYPVKEFYRYWTIKESVIKAEGKGLSIPLDKLEVNNNIVQYDGKSWLVHTLEVSNSYCAAIATNQLSEYKINEMDFY